MYKCLWKSHEEDISLTESPSASIKKRLRRFKKNFSERIINDEIDEEYEEYMVLQK